jgi:peptidoglycan/LPS O-acetylase OafA/YrhL
VGFVVLRAAADLDSRTARMLSARPLLFLGRISYGLYLWHLILLWTPPRSIYCPYGVRVAIAFAAAWLSYRYIEAPFLRRKRAARPAVEQSAQSVPLPAPAAA